VAEFERLADRFGWRIRDHASLRDGVWWGKREGDLSYPEGTGEAIAAVEDHSAWFRHRNRVIGDLVGAARPAALWEVGSGNGFVARGLQRGGIEAVCVEPLPFGAKTAAERGVAASVCARFEQLELPDDSLPAVGCFDVLEHLADPDALVGEMRRVLEPGGWLFVTVPAMPALWSQADEASGHFRRYTRHGLDRAMKGFQRMTSAYFMAPLAIPIFLLRALPLRLGRRRSVSQVRSELVRDLGTFGSRLLAWERPWVRRRALPFGSSLAGAYRKNQR
jgi:SAM-dependent methyltransferase